MTPGNLNRSALILVCERTGWVAWIKIEDPALCLQAIERHQTKACTIRGEAVSLEMIPWADQMCQNGDMATNTASEAFNLCHFPKGLTSYPYRRHRR